MPNLCIPPIRWLQRWFVPPRDDDWERVAYSPMLYLCMWTGALLFLVLGDFTAIEQDRIVSALGWLWLGLSLLCPPMALASLWMIESPHGAWKYRGLWTRLGADAGFFFAITAYFVQKLNSGDYHVYSIFTLVSIVIFCAHIVMRDVRRLIAVERLAGKIHRGRNPQ